MSFTIWQNGVEKDISLLVKSESAVCNKRMSMDLNAPFGESEFNCELWDNVLIDNVRFKPIPGDRIQWKADDGTDNILFDGIVQKPKQAHAGAGVDSARLDYAITAKGPEVLFEQKIVPEGVEFTRTAGLEIDYLTVVADPRIIPDSSNDVGYTLGKKKLARLVLKQAVEEISKESGLLLWITPGDQTNIWKLHHKQYASVFASVQDSKFNITDTSGNYKNLELYEDDSKFCTRVHVIGSEENLKNPQNRKQGKKKRADNIVTVTASLEAINQERISKGFPPHPDGTNVNNLPNTDPGIVEREVDFQDCYDIDVLTRRGNLELAMYGKPVLTGTVSFYMSGLEVGKSIYINSETLKVNTLVPVIELTISSAEGSGYNSSKKKQYFYTCQLGGPSEFTKIKQAGKEPARKKAKENRLIKPNPPGILSGTLTDSIEVLNVEASYTIRGQKDFQ